MVRYVSLYTKIVLKRPVLVILQPSNNGQASVAHKIIVIVHRKMYLVLSVFFYNFASAICCSYNLHTPLCALLQVVCEDR